MREVDIDSDTLASKMTEVQTAKADIDSSTMLDDLASTLSGLKLSG